MSTILYYSNYCENSKLLLANISNSNIKNDMHFISIDKRTQKNNGATYIQLENGQEILLPPTINKVPALLLLNKGHKVLFGNEINQYLEPKQVIEQNIATSNNGEPLAFSLCGNNCFGVASDNYSFLDQDSDELSAKGNGGLRQQHHYSVLDHNGPTIETPPDNYDSNTIGNVSIEQLQQKRENDIK